jgi:hypothetical protein
MAAMSASVPRVRVMATAVVPAMMRRVVRVMGGVLA